MILKVTLILYLLIVGRCVLMAIKEKSKSL